MDLFPVLDLAARYANESLPGYFRGSQIFAPPNDNSFSLFYEPKTVEGQIRVAKRQGVELRSEEEVMDDLVQIVQDSVQRALSEYKEGRLFAALIVENLRNGRDAFTTGTDDQVQD